LQTESMFPVGDDQWCADWSKLHYVQLQQDWLEILQNSSARLSVRYLL